MPFIFLVLPSSVWSHIHALWRITVLGPMFSLFLWLWRAPIGGFSPELMVNGILAEVINPASCFNLHSPFPPPPKRGLKGDLHFSTSSPPHCCPLHPHWGLLQIWTKGRIFSQKNGGGVCLNKNTSAPGVSVAGFVFSFWLSTGLAWHFQGMGLGFRKENSTFQPNNSEVCVAALTTGEQFFGEDIDRQTGVGHDSRCRCLNLVSWHVGDLMWAKLLHQGKLNCPPYTAHFTVES